MVVKGRITNIIPFLALVMLWLSPGCVWASPINFKKMSDDQIWLGMVFAIIVLIVQALLGVYALIRYWQNYKISKKGLHPLIVLSLVVATAVFWSVVFYFYVTGEGAQYIG